MWRSDEELMSSCRDGDEAAFEVLYRRYEKPILSFIYRIVVSAADAEDLCQEAFFKVVQAKKTYQVSGKFKTWLFRIALNLCRDRIRRMKFRSHASLDDPVISQEGQNIQPRRGFCDSSFDPAKSAEAEEMKTLVQKAFATLPENQRTVIVLKEYHALTFSEIAEIMECPIGTAKSLNYRGHQKLLKILSKYID